LIWAYLIREMAGLEPDTRIIGGFDLLSEIMSKSGMQRFRAYLKAHPAMTELHKRRVIAAFLDRYALEGASEQEVDLPGWTQDTIRVLTENYEDDLIRIRAIQGVNLITP